MYIVNERRIFEIIDPENYAVIKTFADYERVQAEAFANMANAVAINEKAKFDKQTK
jgi:hypothetical protein